MENTPVAMVCTWVAQARWFSHPLREFLTFFENFAPLREFRTYFDIFSFTSIRVDGEHGGRALAAMKTAAPPGGDGVSQAQAQTARWTGGLWCMDGEKVKGKGGRGARMRDKGR